MESMEKVLSPDILRLLIDYDPATGVARWKDRDSNYAKFPNQWNSTNSGKALGCVNRYGYFQTSLLGKQYKVHRIVWAIHHGEWPTFHIDHINGIRTDNRIENLREATFSVNAKNQSKPKNNSSGVVGVDRKNGKWRARISNNGFRIDLGSFPTKKEAVYARREAEKRIGYTSRHGL